MGVNVALGPGAAVAAEQMPDPVRRLGQRIAVDQALQAFQVQAQRLQQRRQVRGVPLAGDIAFGKADHAAGQHAADEAVVLDQDAALGAAVDAADGDVEAVRGDDFEHAARPVARGQADELSEGRRRALEFRKGPDEVRPKPGLGVTLLMSYPRLECGPRLPPIPHVGF